jgi:uncharacterized membrane protein YfcA
MTGLQLPLLVALFFLTSAISVVTGSTSVITVPAMFHFGIEPRSAVATNRMTFLEAIAMTKLLNVFSSGIAVAVFARQGLVDYGLGLLLGRRCLPGRC